MVRQYIVDQLARCAFANPSSYDKKTNTFIIPKYTKAKFDLGKSYIIQIPEILMQPDAVLTTNWNQGKIPPNNYLKIYVSKTLGKMIYVDAVAFDINKNIDLNVWWSGWLPVEEIYQLSKLD